MSNAKPSNENSSLEGYDMEQTAQVMQIEAVQASMLRKLKESRATLEIFHIASSAEVDGAVQELHMHCELLKMIKKDMDSIYTTIRKMKRLLRQEQDTAERAIASGAWEDAANSISKALLATLPQLTEPSSIQEGYLAPSQPQLSSHRDDSMRVA
jgi:hypothetical protein